MKKKYRIYKSGNSWKIEQINWWGVVYELYMYGTGDITYKSFATKEEAQEVIDKHRRLEAKYNKEFDDYQKAKKSTGYIY